MAENLPEMQCNHRRLRIKKVPTQGKLISPV